ncbi:hypothetical protein F0562_015215 [Nyssa sinensis]|uniref:Uncharacterized protein n=1 Tax=Nyssa sinensis TaxID=561372 RepID=A0A5J4ZJI3_9ASTE|nr:hypothetical protein F0562_015215 [Nyssa sinensis]
MERRDGSVIREPVFPSDDTEADDVVLVVEDLEALGAVFCREAGNDVNLAESADVAVPDDDVAALDEVLVGLWIVEAADDGPHCSDRGGDLLDGGCAALVGAHREGGVWWIRRHLR